jgi:[ribosomal protein S5]-alanine N-acetyltransferase
MTTVAIRPVAREDGPALAAANAASIALHRPWTQPFTDLHGFTRWHERQAADDRAVSYVALADATIIGVVSLSEIVRGAFLNAYLGYYGRHGCGGRGCMTEAVRQVLGEAFGALGLHRVEANIQPGNTRSIALVRRLGFRREGLSPRYLRIDGLWRDHERWALCADDPQERR